MHHPATQFPDRHYLDGLLAGDADVLHQIYQEFRPAIVRAVSAAGGSVADGAVFFQLAVLEAAALERSGQWPEQVPFFHQLRSLALQQYTDWLEERDQSIASNSTTPIDPTEEPETDPLLLPADALRRTRHKIFAWKCLERLEPGCRETLLAPDNAEGTSAPLDGPCLEQWRSLLFLSDSPADEAGEALRLPDWVEAARLDVEGYRLWRAVDALEHRLASGEVTEGPRRNRRLPLVLAAIFVGLIGWGLYQWLSASKSPGAVYREHFSLPESILNDMQARYDADTSAAVVERPLECDALFQEADRLYRDKEYRAATAPLTELLADSLSHCHSDAYFYLGLISLRLDEPEIALQCFSKIEDIENFGEDIYWYQALAIVKLAAHNPGMREKARRAVERAVANSRDEARRQQAEEVLKDLSGD